ncbi:LysR substrate-binding domain-containing protein [Fulvivirgaceae bacterium BMA10]|uniref:LysR substrate-binding domain-containing protein n=1 Tax=Splendidivirga corallicola TaxID=3051826 RepID=A0ABT8KKS9_9BACT|nr:LysR substrate-binding domain-containing protein [Fulvivirgaceae bacterium BMA10]
MLSFRHEVFFEVAKQLSFSKASETLFISQPAISKHIKSLEEAYSATLFERKGNTISLTDSGKILYNHLLKTKEIQKQLEFEISTLNDQSKAKGTLKLGASTTVALYIVPSVLSAFHQKHPNVHLNLLNRNSENILKALLEHDIDLGIIEGKHKITTVKYKHFLTDEVVAVCSTNSELAKVPSLSVKDLKEVPIALRERGSGTLSAIAYSLKKHKIKISDLNVIIRLGGTEALKNFILADTSLGFLPLRSVIKEIANDDLVRVDIPDLKIQREFYFIRRQGSDGDGLGNAFINFALNHYNLKL